MSPDKEPRGTWYRTGGPVVRGGALPTPVSVPVVTDTGQRSASATSTLHPHPVALIRRGPRRRGTPDSTRGGSPVARIGSPPGCPSCHIRPVRRTGPRSRFGRQCGRPRDIAREPPRTTGEHDVGPEQPPPPCPRTP